MPTTFVRAATRALSILALVLGAGAAGAAPVEPPVELLYASGNLLVAGPLIDINPSGRLVFARKDVLGGKPRPPEQIDVRVPTSLLAEVKIGERYIFGYSMYRPDRQASALVANREGATLLVSMGLEPALFRDTPATRTLLKVGRSEFGRESRRFRDLIMQALAGSDPQLQNLAAGEIALAPDVRAHLRDTAMVERVVRNAQTRPSIRALLLQAAVDHPQELGDWWQATAIEIVTTTPTGGYADEASDPSGLVLGALDVLDQRAVRVTADALQRWLHSANPSLAERVALMLRRESPALERTAIRKALADPTMPAQTRQFLDDRLRRLDRSESGAEPRKEGSG